MAPVTASARVAAPVTLQDVIAVLSLPVSSLELSPDENAAANRAREEYSELLARAMINIARVEYRQS